MKYKKILSIIITSLVLSTIFISCTSATSTNTISNIEQNQSDIVVFEDPSLENYLKSVLHISPKDPITKSKLLELEKLALGVNESYSLEGIQYATNLKTLFISDFRVKDYSVINKLHNLEKLEVWNGNLNSLNFATSLTKLKKLTIVNSSLKDISSISVAAILLK